MKTIKKQLKRAFTIVELVIVIAVVAALAAILIPTFVNVVNSANEAVDTSLVKNLNTILASEEILNGGQATTMGEALEWAEDNGYSVEKITPTSAGYDIAWDETSNRFVLMDGDTAVYSDDTTDETEWSLWYITTSNTISTSTDKQYYYASSTALSGTVNVTSSVDLSAQTNVTSVNVNATNSNITVAVSNAALVVANEGTNLVNVYGTVTTITGNNYGSESLHIYGTVTGKIELSKGHVVAEAGSYIESLIITAETVTEENKVSVEVKSSATVNSIAATSSNVLSSINSYVSGASSSSIVSTTVSSDFAGGTGTAASPYQISTVDQFLKIGDYSSKMSAGNSYYFDLIADIDLSSVSVSVVAVSDYFCGTLNGNDHILVANDNLSYIFKNAVGTTVFEDINYQLNTVKIFLCGGQDAAYAGNKYLTLNDIDISTVKDETVINLYGSNDGILYGWVGASVGEDEWLSNNYENQVTIINCDIDLNISGSSYNGVFIGGGVYHSSAIVKDCSYTGRFTGEYVNLVLGNSYDYSGSGTQQLTITNVINYGSLRGTERDPLIAGGNGQMDASWADISGCNLGDYLKLSDTNLNVFVGNNETMVVTAAEKTTEYYVLTFTGGTRYTSSVSENSSYRFSIKLTNITFTNNTYDTGYKDGVMLTVAQYKSLVTSSASFDENSATNVYGETGAKFWVTTYSGTVYYVFDFDNNNYYFGSSKTSQAVNINNASITAYDSDGYAIAQKTIEIK